jgi:hypothetical protein
VARRRLISRSRDRIGQRRRWERSERITAGLAVASIGVFGALLAGQYTRMITRRVQQPTDEGVIDVAPTAALDTVGVAVEGYSATPHGETVLFNLLSGFLGSFAFVRISTWGMRGGWWPLGNVRVGGRHIHHFVPGILLAFASGTAALITDDADFEDRLALPMGIGMGLTFDEAALLLDLRDVYWTREGLLSVQISFGLSAMIGATILAMRMLRRGERHQEQAGVIPTAPHGMPGGFF